MGTWSTFAQINSWESSSNSNPLLFIFIRCCLKFVETQVSYTLNGALEHIIYHIFFSLTNSLLKLFWSEEEEVKEESLRKWMLNSLKVQLIWLQAYIRVHWLRVHETLPNWDGWRYLMHLRGCRKCNWMKVECTHKVKRCICFLQAIGQLLHSDGENATAAAVRETERVN